MGMLEAGWHHEGLVPLVPDVGEGFFVGQKQGRDETRSSTKIAKDTKKKRKPS